MKWYEVYEGLNGWDVYEVTGGGQHYVMFKRFKTKKGVENWAKKQWYRVDWR